MRIRVKFAKYDTMRFIGHLDVMRYVQRLIRRSGLPVKYSDGYHPHQILSFAQPLGLGLTSDGEYFDSELTEEVETEEIKRRLNENISYGYEIIDVVRLSDREVNRKIVTAMSLITRSAYLIISKNANEGMSEAFASWLEKPEINVIKKSKKSEREIELKQFIYEVNDLRKGNVPLYASKDVIPVLDDKTIECGRVHAPEFDGEHVFAVSLCAGSETNIAPDFFMESFLAYYDPALSPQDFRYHRMELYGNEPKESKSLCQILL